MKDVFYDPYEDEKLIPNVAVEEEPPQSFITFGEIFEKVRRSNGSYASDDALNDFNLLLGIWIKDKGHKFGQEVEIHPSDDHRLPFRQQVNFFVLKFSKKVDIVSLEKRSSRYGEPDGTITLRRTTTPNVTVSLTTSGAFFDRPKATSQTTLV